MPEAPPVFGSCEAADALLLLSPLLVPCAER